MIIVVIASTVIIIISTAGARTSNSIINMHKPDAILFDRSIEGASKRVSGALISTKT